MTSPAFPQYTLDTGTGFSYLNEYDKLDVKRSHQKEYKSKLRHP
jgi:hypothetical protein